MKIPREMPTIKLYDGEILYIDIRSPLLLRLNKSCFRLSDTKITLLISVDWLPLFKSSSLELYPILGMCKNVYGHIPFVIASFCGTEKPHPLKTF